MSFSAPVSVVSGLAYRVVSVNGSEPVSLDQFIGDVDVAVANHGEGSLSLRGQGSANDVGVRFQEKDVENTGKDIRVWQVAEVDHTFAATSIAAF